MIQSYHTGMEISAILAACVAEQEPVRRAWEAVGDDNHAALAFDAQADLDACAWRGQRASSGQTAAWPRVGVGGINTESSLPGGAGSDVTAWSVPGLPANLRIAHAIQAGWHAAILLGADGGVQGRLDDAARGIAGVSGGGQSFSIDPLRADRPRLRLHPKARALVAAWLAHTAEAI